jgi:hypothetical protein
MVPEWEKDARPAIEQSCLRRSWISGAAVQSLLELNAECVQLLAEQARDPRARPVPVLRPFAELWRSLTTMARQRLARCPYLLVDLGFADPERWRFRELAVRDLERAAYAAFFNIPRAATVARRVFAFAWDLARTEEVAARFLLGMPAHCTSLIRSLTVRELDELAERHADWLLPRWHRYPKIWRNLLVAARSCEFIPLQRVVNHGYDLIEAQSRASVLRALHGTGMIWTP